MIRAAALALLILPAVAGARPMRVMSINQCTDQLVLALLPRERIASVTSLSRDPQDSLLAARAMRVGVNHGQAEEVVRQRPDLVVAGSFSTPATRALLRRLGYPLLEVDQPESFADIRRVTRQVAAALGEARRGEALIARMDGKLAALAAERMPPVRIAAWDGAGFNARPGSLYDALLTAAGAVNVANRPPASAYAAPDSEVLLAAAPALLVQGIGASAEHGPREDIARSPIVRRLWHGRTIRIRPALYVCGTPFAGDAAVAIRRALRAAAR